MDLFARLQQMKIMLVEDDEWIQDSMRLFLEGEGCHLKTFDTAEEAFAELENEMAEIVIADYRLPRMDGVTFFDRIRQTFDHQPIKILISAYLNRSVKEQARRAGVHELIEKPFQSETIEEALERLLVTGRKTPALRG